MGYHVYLRHGNLVCWHLKTWLESGPVQASRGTVEPNVNIFCMGYCCDNSVYKWPP